MNSRPGWWKPAASLGAFGFALFLLLTAPAARAQSDDKNAPPTARAQTAQSNEKDGAPAPRTQSDENDAIPADVKEVLGRMGKTLQAKDFSFQSDTLRAHAGANGELLHIAHKTKITAHRPDRLSLDISGDDGATKMLYDGKALVIYGAGRNEYGSIPVSGNLDEMLATAETRFGIDMPLADFFTGDPAKSFLDGVTSGGQVGTVTIDGTPCRYFFFSQAPDLQLELWVEDNDRALPRRLIVTYLSLPGRPQFIAALSNWDLTTTHPDADFVFQPPAGAKQVELARRAGAPQQSSQAPQP